MVSKHAMKTILVLAVGAAVAVTVGFRPAGERIAVAVRYSIEQGSQLSIQGTTNVNSFECFSKQAFNQQAVQLAIDPVTKAVSFDRAVLHIKVKELDCDNNKMNADLCDALNYERFPNITIKLHDAKLVSGSISSEWSEIIVNATLKITDQERRVELRAKGKIVDGGRYRFVANKALKMTDFGVEPPTALMGLIRVRDEITINFDLVTKVNVMSGPSF
ncbi:MAG: YceI family protein [Ignavibacteriae bacterium]|nr:MAG: YceI family protein [Ignavibacteriota bacterium]